ncbi:MAG: hypothetical protein ACR2LJ_00160 [Acidimicrobiales bacterium]
MRFPDGSRRKVERVEKSDTQADLDRLLDLRARSLDPGPSRSRMLSFNDVDDLVKVADPAGHVDIPERRRAIDTPYGRRYRMQSTRGTSCSNDGSYGRSPTLAGKPVDARFRTAILTTVAVGPPAVAANGEGKTGLELRLLG